MKRILHIDYDYDFLLIGICTHAKNYRLCWEINKILGIKLERGDDMTIKTSNGESSAYSLYFCEDEENNNYFHVISNKSQNKTLITEHKQVDYFLRIQGNRNTGYAEETLKKIRKIPIVLTAYNIDPNKLKSKQKLLF